VLERFSAASSGQILPSAGLRAESLSEPWYWKFVTDGIAAELRICRALVHEFIGCCHTRLSGVPLVRYFPVGAIKLAIAINSAPWRGS